MFVEGDRHCKREGLFSFFSLSSRSRKTLRMAAGHFTGAWKERRREREKGVDILLRCAEEDNYQENLYLPRSGVFSTET